MALKQFAFTVGVLYFIIAIICVFFLVVKWFPAEMINPIMANCFISGSLFVAYSLTGED